MKKRVVSVLVFPYVNGLKVQVTRGDTPITYPLIHRNYFMEYSNPKINHFYYWAKRLHDLNLDSVFNTMMERYGSKK